MHAEGLLGGRSHGREGKTKFSGPWSRICLLRKQSRISRSGVGAEGGGEEKYVDTSTHHTVVPLFPRMFLVGNGGSGKGRE